MYDYQWYKENCEIYQKSYTQDFDLKNKYFLLAIGGTVAILIPVLEKFGDVIKLLLLIEISLLIFLGFLILYSLLKSVEVNEKYLENYHEVYKIYGEQRITDENSVIVNGMLQENKFYDEAIKNEKKIKLFFKAIIVYTVFLLISIIFRETNETFDKIIKEKVGIEINTPNKEIKSSLIKKEELKSSRETNNKNIEINININKN